MYDQNRLVLDQENLYGTVPVISGTLPESAPAIEKIATCPMGTNRGRTGRLVCHSADYLYAICKRCCGGRIERGTRGGGSIESDRRRKRIEKICWLACWCVRGLA